MTADLSSRQSTAAPKKEPRIVLVMVLMIAFLAVAKSFNSQFTVSKIPGPERGDLVLSEDSLPPELAGWKRTQFQPAEVPSDLPDGQFWWVHAWGYSDGQVACTLSLDQADWTSWHDLTVCYQAVGWKLEDRRVLDIPYPQGGTWHVVTADFSEPSGRRAFLVFSLFGDDGTPMDSPWQGLYPEPVDDSFAKRMGDRFSKRPAESSPVQKKVNHTRVLQSQVFLAYSGTLTAERREQLIQVHLEARPRFQDAWNKHWAKWQATAR
ncbi:MAG: exosortase U [Planctomyces sp.]